MSFHHENPADDGRDLGALRGMLAMLMEKITGVEAAVLALAGRNSGIGEAKNGYSTAEFAEKVGRAEYTVRQWCLNERINAEKAAAGRGVYGEWRITHDELVRYMNEGLLPLPRRRR